MPSRFSSPAAPAANTDLWRDRTFFWLALALIPLVMVLRGYNFGIVNHNEQLPMILRMLDPSYLKADWIVNANQGFNHRWFYSELMALLSHLFTVPGAFYLVYIGTLVVWATGTCALFRLLWGGDTDNSASRSAGVLGLGGVLVVAFTFFLNWGTISDSGFGLSLVPGAIAWPLAIWVAVYLLRDKWKVAAVIMLVAGLIHPQIGPLSGFFMLMAQLYALSGPSTEATAIRRRALLRHWPLWVLSVGLPLGLAVISTRGRPLTPEQAHQALYILTYVRHPWHYVPTSWQRGDWIMLLGWLLLIVAVRQATRPSRFLDGLLGVTFLFCLSGFLPFLVSALFPLAKLQHFRMTVWLQIGGFFYLGCFIADLIAQQDKVRRVAGFIFAIGLLMQVPLWLGSKFVLLFPLSVALFIYLERDTREGRLKPRWIALLPLVVWLPVWIVIKHSHGSIKNAILGTLVSIVVLGIAWLIINREEAPLEAGSSRLALRLSQAVAACGALLLLVAALPHVSGPLNRVLKGINVRYRYPGLDGQVERWVDKNTPQDAIFLVSPNFETFRLKANRAIVADFKVFPWTDAGLLDWRQRIADLSGGKNLSLGYDAQDQLQAAYAALTPAQVIQLSQRYGVTYFIAPTDAKSDFSRWPVIFSNPSWRVYRLSPA